MAVVSSSAYSTYSPLFQSLFEVTRRWKIMNPEKLRGVYGKLVYLLQASPNLNPSPTPKPSWSPTTGEPLPKPPSPDPSPTP